MTAIKDVTGTAFIVAEFRVEENNEAHPLYVDHVVPLFLSDTTRAAARAIQQDFPPAGKNLRLRTRYFDDRLDTAIAQGCRQVVILGAGLDTRAVRKSAPGVVFFEIDDAATLSFKRERLAAGGITEPAVLIPGDYVADGVLKLLERNGFSRDEPAFFIWEGNTMYLTRPAVMAVLRELASGVSRFSISLDYMDEQIIDRTTGDQPTSDFVARFAAMGAPWSFGCNNVHPLADEAGLAVVDVVSLAELHHTFWPDRSAGWTIDKHYFLCMLSKGA
jgi:methyltransferase (TIGR00027 family)